jgi:hypothetical protein
VLPPRRDDRSFRNDAPAHPPEASREAILAPAVVDVIRAERDTLVRRIVTELPPAAPMARDIYVGAAGIASMWFELASAG